MIEIHDFVFGKN